MPKFDNNPTKLNDISNKFWSWKKTLLVIKNEF